MNRIDRYLATALLQSLVPVVVMLLALFGFLAFLEELEEVGEGRFDAFDALAVVGLTMPARLLELTPVTLMLAGLIGVGRLAGAMELVALRAAGVPPARIGLTLAVLVVALSLSVLSAVQPLLPLAESQAQALRAKQFDRSGRAESGYWALLDDEIVHFDGIGGDGTLSGLEVYHYEGGALREVLQAQTAAPLDSGAWRLSSAYGFRAQDAQSQEVRDPTRVWRQQADDDRLRLFALPAEALRLADLRALMAQAQANELPSTALAIQYWQRLSLPLSALALVCLTLPLLFGSLRQLAGSARVTLGVMLGVLFYLLEQGASQLALTGWLSPAVWALAPEVLGITLGGYWLRRVLG